MNRVMGVMMLLALLLASHLQASVPHVFNYQGYLSDLDGLPLEGNYNLVFRIYDVASGADPALWTETHTLVQVVDGVFSVLLGSLVDLPPSVLAENELWIGVTVGADSEVVPRLQVTSTPWAIRAAIADSVVNGGGTVGDGHSLDAGDGDPLDVINIDDDGHVMVTGVLPPGLPSPLGETFHGVGLFAEGGPFGPTPAYNLKIQSLEKASGAGIRLQNYFDNVDPGAPEGRNYLNITVGEHTASISTTSYLDIYSANVNVDGKLYCGEMTCVTDGHFRGALSAMDEITALGGANLYGDTKIHGGGGASECYVLTSDAVGVATWQEPSVSVSTTPVSTNNFQGSLSLTTSYQVVASVTGVAPSGGTFMVTATIGMFGFNAYTSPASSPAFFGISTNSTSLPEIDKYHVSMGPQGFDYQTSNTSTVHLTEVVASPGETTFYLLANRHAFGNYTVTKAKITAVFIDSDPN